MLVTDRSLVPSGALSGVVERVVAGGVDAVQLREKDLPAAEAVALGRALRAVTRGRAVLLVNGDADLARACDADGVHLSGDARFPSGGEPRGLIVGRSVHSLADARRAEAEGADYLLLGTIFPSRSHPGSPTGGVDAVDEVVAAVHVPVIAIGGITVSTAGAVMGAGAAGVAVIAAILAAPDPGQAAAALRKTVDSALERRGESVMTTATITVTVNGKPHRFTDGLPLPEVIRQLAITFPRIAVAHNGTVLRAEEHAATRVHDGDTLEIVRMVGGGADE